MSSYALGKKCKNKHILIIIIPEEKRQTSRPSTSHNSYPIFEGTAKMDVSRLSLHLHKYSLKQRKEEIEVTSAPLSLGPRSGLKPFSLCKGSCTTAWLSSAKAQVYIHLYHDSNKTFFLFFSGILETSLYRGEPWSSGFPMMTTFPREHAFCNGSPFLSLFSERSRKTGRSEEPHFLLHGCEISRIL